jgi:hypothetical protein
MGVCILPPLGKEAHALALNGLGRIMNLYYLLLLLPVQTGEDSKRS